MGQQHLSHRIHQCPQLRTNMICRKFYPPRKMFQLTNMSTLYIKTINEDLQDLSRYMSMANFRRKQFTVFHFLIPCSYVYTSHIIVRTQSSKNHRLVCSCPFLKYSFFSVTHKSLIPRISTAIQV